MFVNAECTLHTDFVFGSLQFPNMDVEQEATFLLQARSLETKAENRKNIATFWLRLVEYFLRLSELVECWSRHVCR